MDTEMVKKIDDTIIKISDEILGEYYYPENLSDIVIAFAALIEARTKINICQADND